VLFASNHQSHMDVPVILMALPGRWRAPRRDGDVEGVLQGALHAVGLHLAPVVHELAELLPGVLLLQHLPDPQREAGARQTLQYIGELTGGGWSVLIFPRASARRPARSSRFRGGVG